MKLNLNIEDIWQIVIGSFALAVPISFSEEAWNLSQSLPVSNLLLVLTLSIFFLIIYTYQSVFQANISNRITVFCFRVILAYAIAFLIVGLILLSLNKLPLIEDPVTALKRLIIVTMPASMGGIIVDSFDKE